MACASAVPGADLLPKFMNSPEPAPLSLLIGILAAFPILFSAMWWFVCQVLSTLGGWRRVARVYPAPGPPEGKVFSGQQGRMGMANYKGTLTFHTTPEGVYVKVMVLFKFGHPPLFIPWSAMHNPKSYRLFWIEAVRVQIGDPSIATLDMPKKVYEERPV
jgi:hypothetical protein